MAEKKVFKFMWYAYDWRGSASVSELSLAERGLYFDLLNASFVADDCGLPTDEKKLAQLARVDIEEFKKVWPSVKQFFVKKKNRLYNNRMVEVKKDAERNYKTAVENGKKGGRPSNSNEGKSKTHRLSKTEPRDNPLVKQPKPEPELELKPEIDMPEERLSEPESIQDIMAGGLGFTVNDINSRIRQFFSEEDWKRSGNWFEYMAEQLDRHTEFEEVISYAEDCLNPEIRRAKGLGELKNPGGYLRNELIGIAKDKDVEIPSDRQARKYYES